MAAAPRQVLMLAGGGVAHTSGGVGTQIGYWVDCWASDPQAPSVRVLDTRGAGGAAGGAWAFARAWAILAWTCLLRRTSLVHAHMTTRGSVVRKCLLCGTANLFGTPTVIHQHGADFHDYFRRQPRPFQHVIRAVLNRAGAVVVLGESWRDFLVREVGVERGRVRVIVNGVPRPTAPPERHRAADDEPRILFLGRLGERKGVPELVAALGRDRVRARPWHAVLAGDGDIVRYRRQVAEAGLSERVDVLGWQDRHSTATLLRQADILALPSHHEAMPVAILEALSHGVAVVATPVGAIPEFLGHGREALLVPPGDVDSLSDALLTLLEEPATRSELAEAGHRTFLARFEIGTVARKLLALYREVGRFAGQRGGEQVAEQRHEAS